MGQAATKASEHRALHKAKPQNGRKIQQQKIQTAQATGMLALSQSQLKKIPEEVVQLAPQLRSLDLSGNKLKELPIEINKCKKLKTLKLQGNRLTCLPDLSGLVSLTTVGRAFESLIFLLSFRDTDFSVEWCCFSIYAEVAGTRWEPNWTDRKTSSQSHKTLSKRKCVETNSDEHHQSVATPGIGHVRE
jgi:Leucine-rich repeat (LRR) protein